MPNQTEELHLRLDKLEEQHNQEVLALIEILSNASFFGELKKANCQYAINGQCALFILKNDTKNKIPLASECRIKQCAESVKHYHIELSSVTCTLCHEEDKELLSSSHYKNTDKTGPLEEIREEST